MLPEKSFHYAICLKYSNLISFVRISKFETLASIDSTSHISRRTAISIDSSRLDLGYELKAEDIFWCKQGILWVKQLRDSEDEEMVADLIASIVLGNPIARSKELLDEIYDSSTEIYDDVRSSLVSYGENKVYEEVKATLSVLMEIINSVDPEPNALRKIINPGSTNPIKAAFYSLFMTLHDLVICNEMTPDNPGGIMNALKGLQKRMREHFTLFSRKISLV
jgi:hypothetical protein